MCGNVHIGVTMTSVGYGYFRIVSVEFSDGDLLCLPASHRGARVLCSPLIEEEEISAMEWREWYWNITGIAYIYQFRSASPQGTLSKCPVLTLVNYLSHIVTLWSGVSRIKAIGVDLWILCSLLAISLFINFVLALTFTASSKPCSDPSNLLYCQWFVSE